MPVTNLLSRCASHVIMLVIEMHMLENSRYYFKAEGQRFFPFFSTRKVAIYITVKLLGKRALFNCL